MLGLLNVALVAVALVGVVRRRVPWVALAVVYAGAAMRAAEHDGELRAALYAGDDADPDGVRGMRVWPRADLESADQSRLLWKRSPREVGPRYTSR